MLICLIRLLLIAGLLVIILLITVLLKTVLLKIVLLIALSITLLRRSLLCIVYGSTASGTKSRIARNLISAVFTKSHNCYPFIDNSISCDYCITTIKIIMHNNKSVKQIKNICSKNQKKIRNILC